MRLAKIKIEDPPRRRGHAPSPPSPPSRSAVTSAPSKQRPGSLSVAVFASTPSQPASASSHRVAHVFFLDVRLDRRKRGPGESTQTVGQRDVKKVRQVVRQRRPPRPRPRARRRRPRARASATRRASAARVADFTNLSMPSRHGRGALSSRANRSASVRVGAPCSKNAHFHMVENLYGQTYPAVDGPIRFSTWHCASPMRRADVHPSLHRPLPRCAVGRDDILELGSAAS